MAKDSDDGSETFKMYITLAFIFILYTYQLKITVSNIQTTQSPITRLAITQSKHVKMSHLKVPHIN